MEPPALPLVVGLLIGLPPLCDICPDIPASETDEFQVDLAGHYFANRRLSCSSQLSHQN